MTRPRRPGRFLNGLLAVGAVAALLPQVAPASPGLRPEAQAGAARDLFREPEPFGPLRPGAPLLSTRPPRAPLLEGSTPFAEKVVVVDSGGVHYQPRTAGLPAGAPLTLPLASYLQLGHRHVYQKGWREAVRNRFQRQGQQGRAGRGRLEWHVPVPGPKPIRRLIGDEGSLRITGQHTAGISGKSSWTAGEVQTLAGRTSKFPTLSMEQESKFAVEGSVGEAINLRITQDTESLGSAFSQNLSEQLQNQIKLDYKGDEDDIFQEVQAGNTTLLLPNTRFVGFNQQHKGLFGIRAKGHLGPMAFTTIASHEKSESNRQTFRGGAQVDTVAIHDYDYIPNQWFFLDRRYRDRLSDFADLNTGIPADFQPADRIDELTLQVFINDFNVNNDAEQLARAGVAMEDPSGPLNKSAGFSEVGTWHRLDPDNDYSLVGELGYLILRLPVQERHALAVAYRTAGGEQLGSVPPAPDSLRLKLIKARDARPDFPTWDLEWKNVYRIVRGFTRGRLFDEDKIRVEILKEVPGQEPENTQGGRPYLQLMGLDVHGQDPGTRPDQIIDADYVGLDGSQGVLIFPDLRPFDPANPAYQKLETRVPGIYDKQQQRDRIEASRYLIRVINSSGQQRINLGQGRLASIDVESVDVRLNGRRLTPGTDYNVSFTGEVQFIGETASAVADPGADLEITYESQDVLFLGSQQKTLLGARGEYEFWDGDGTVGSTVLYNNVRSAERRVRVGTEPARAIVWDFDLRARRTSSLLTRAVDALPLLKTAATSDVTVQAEVAQSRPNLNTKGQGYIDDFEGAERPEILSVYRTRWTPASAPAEARLDEDSRGRTVWYNPFDRVLRTAIWPGQEDQVEANNNKTDVLAIEVVPRPASTRTWGGLQTVFTGGVRDFSQSKFLDLWLRGKAGQLHIDLGDISEDWIANGRIDTEDEPLPGRTTGDGQVSEAEDIGIDGRTDAQELDWYLARAGVDTAGLDDGQKRQQFRALAAYADRDAADPEGDNWDYDATRNRGDYQRINGTQGNARGQEGAPRPDTEDLNNDGNLSTRNDYYHYAIDLAADPDVPGTRSDAGWRLYRIPLYDEEVVERVGSPDSSRIEFARLTFVTDNPAGDTARVEIAQLEIVGNEWQVNDVARLPGGGVVTDDETFDVTVIGTDQNLSYRPPPGVRARRLVNSRAREREQSLVLAYENLDAGHEASATRVLTGNADYTKYTRLRMFAHGDASGAYAVGADSSDLELFLRFGADSLNYYEYITRLFPGWDERNEVDMDLSTMAQLKAELQRGRSASPGVRLAMLDSVVTDPHRRRGAAAVYRVRGNPSMQQVKQLTLGLRNRSAAALYTGQAYTDELRLDEARNDPGLAAFARVNAQLADFMDVDGSVDWQSQDFRTISNTQRNASDLKTSVATTSNLHKFLPGSWGLSVPVKYSFGRSLTLPRFGPNSDVDLAPAQRESLRSEQTKEFVEVTVSKRSGRTWVTRWTLDQMNLRLSQTRERGLSPVTPVDDRDAQTLSFSYKLPLPEPSFAYLGWLPGFVPKALRASELTPLPAGTNYSLNANKQQSVTWRATQRDTTFNEAFSLRETYATKVSPLRSLSSDYSLQIDRDLRKKYQPRKLAFGREVNRTQAADVKLQLRLVSWLDPSFSFQANYQESSDPRRRAQAAILDSATNRPIQTIDVTTKNTLSARLNVRLSQLLQQLGKSNAPGRPGRPQRMAGEAAPGEAPDLEPEAEPGVEPKAEPKVEPKVEKQGGEPLLVRRFLHRAGDHLEPFSANWRRNTDTRNFNLVERPRLLYQFGLDDSLRILQQGAGLTQQDSWNRGTDVDISSGLRLPLGFSAKPSYKDQVSRRSGSSQRRLRVERTESFPSVALNWGRADRIPFLRRYLNSAQVNVNYEERDSQQGEGSLGPRNVIREGAESEWRASYTGQWKAGPTTRFETSRSAGEDLDYELASAADSTGPAGGKPPLRGRSTQEKGSTTFEVRHKLRPRELPLFGKLNSSVDLVLELTADSEVRSSATGDEEPVPISSNDRWKAELRGSYRFSEGFQGDGLALIENDRNNITDKTRMVRELRLSGTLYFK